MATNLAGHAQIGQLPVTWLKKAEHPGPVAPVRPAPIGTEPLIATPRVDGSTKLEPRSPTQDALPDFSEGSGAGFSLIYIVDDVMS